MNETQRQIIPNKHKVTYETIDGEAVVINLDNGKYYSLTGVAGYLWELIENGAAPCDMIHAAGLTYEVEESQLRHDIESFVADLEQEDLVIRSAEPAAPGKRILESPESPAAKQTYQSPVLDSYHDMADLLALDPPMPGLQDLEWNKQPSED